METYPEVLEPRRRVSRAAVAALLSLTLVATLLARPGSDERAGAATAPAGFTANAIATGLNMPTQMAFSPDGKVYVAEKGGVIRVFSSSSASTSTVFKDLSTNVFNNWDRGMLGLTVDPRFNDGVHRYVYVLYAKNGNLLPGGAVPRWNNDVCPTPPGGETDGCVVMGTLSRIKVNADGSAGPEEKMIDDEWCQQYTSHSVGGLAFGSDGYLYVSGGEGASWSNADWGQWGGSLPNTPTPKNPCGDPPNSVGTGNTSPDGRGGAMRSQSPRRPAGEPRLLSGAVLRLNPDTFEGAPDNPMYNSSKPSANESRILAYGMRNPFRFTERPGTGEIWVGDVGQSTWEEINRIPANPAKAPNFGWPCLEGPDQRGGYSNLKMCQDLYKDTVDPATSPWFRYEHDESINSNDNCVNEYGSSVSGLAFYEGDRYPSSYKGSLFVADSSRSCIWVMSKGSNGLPDPSTARTFINTGGTELPVDLKVDPVSGDIFYVSIARPNQDGHLQANTGSIHRIAPTSVPNRAPIAVATATPTSGHAPLTVTLNGTGSSDPDGDTPLNYSWDIDGDGNFGDRTGPTATWTFHTGGTFNVRLKVTDPGGLSGTSEPVAVTVSSGGPVNTSAPSISGPATSSGTLVGGAGGWSPSGYSVAWQWQRCTSASTASCSDRTGATGSTYVVQEADEGARLRLKVTAVNGQGSNTAYSAMTDVVTDGNTAPVPSIVLPATTLRWKSGDRIEFKGTATDTEQPGGIPASGYDWTVVTGHCPSTGNCHTHGLYNASGVSQGSFFAEDHLAPSFISITMGVTDNAGNRQTTTVEIQPYSAVLTARTNHLGLRVGMGDEQKVGPFTQNWVSNSQVQLTAPAQQTVNGTTYYFSGWSHGGAATQVVKVPTSDTTYTANYTTNPNPFGHYETVSSSKGQVSVRGWAIDGTSQTSPLHVQVVVGGTRGTRGAEGYILLADRRRNDVGRSYPMAGSNHGFEGSITTGKRGKQNVCVYALNLGPGKDTMLGCRTVDIVK